MTSPLLLIHQLLQSGLSARVERQGLHEVLAGLFQGRNPFSITQTAIGFQANGHVFGSR